MSKKTKPPKPEIDTSLNCANWTEVSQRCQFQDWVTTHIGYADIKERNRLWDRFKAGLRITVDGKRMVVRISK